MTDNLNNSSLPVELLKGSADDPIPNTVYIAGKMSGIKDLNRPAFDRAERLLKKYGFKPYSPHVINEGRDHAKQKLTCMEADLIHLMRCEYIFLLKGWKDSNGAKMEYNVAKYFNKKILVFKEKWDRSGIYRRILTCSDGGSFVILKSEIPESDFLLA